MCLIILDWQPDSPQPLLLASNRDEFYQRPSATASYWQDAPDIFGGRDLQMGGTWLAVSKQGKLAAVTNYRRPDDQSYPRSRGEIPSQFLMGDLSARHFADFLFKQQQEFAGFNALFFDGEELIYCSNRSDQLPRVLKPGRYGLSNHLLDTPWPKVEKAKAVLDHLNEDVSDEDLEHTLIQAMNDRTQAATAELPDTGVGEALEKLLSAVFIQAPGYGTRASSVVRVTTDSHIYFVEQSYDENGETSKRQRACVPLIKR